MPTHKHHELMAQARIRLAICSFMGLYFLFFGIRNHPVYLLFVIYSSAMLLLVQSRRVTTYISPYVTLIIDNGFSIYGLHVTGESGTFLLFFLIHISFAYGIRFGHRHLYCSLFLACAGIYWLYSASSPWQGRIHFLLSFLFGMPFISLYVISLTNQLQASKNEAIKSRERTINLLAFLTHDIRAPLQYIMEATSTLADEPLSAAAQSLTLSIKRLSNMMARMLAHVLTESGGERIRNVELANDQRGNAAILNRWIISFGETFRQVIEARNASLSYSLPTQIAYLENNAILSVERILSNVFSNAIRYCEGGFVFVKVRELTASPQIFRITIENQKNIQPGAQRTEAPPSPPGLASGSGMGLAVARDVAHSLGAVFSFAKSQNDRFSSTLDIPVAGPPSAYRFETIFPVIVMTDHEDFYRQCASALLGIANVYWKNRQTEFSRSLDGSTGVQAIYICSEDLTSQLFHSGFLQIRSQPQIVVGALLEQDAIRLERETVKIGFHPTTDLLAQALLVAESALLSRLNEAADSLSESIVARGKKVLVLDDSFLNLSITVTGLRNYGLDATAATTIHDAEKLLRSEHYDIFVADWNVGVTTTELLLKSLIELEDTSCPKIVILSADESLLGSQNFQGSELISTLIKPISVGALYKTIVKIVQSGEKFDSEVRPPLLESIFGAHAFVDADLTQETYCVSRNLLLEFLESADRAIASIEEGIGQDSRGDLENLHRSASMCYSAGAYALGDEFKRIHASLSEANQGAGARISRTQLFSLRKIFEITAAHVSAFLDSMSSQLSKLPG